MNSDKRTSTFSERLHLACDHAGIPREKGRTMGLYSRVKNAGVIASYESVRRWLQDDARPRMRNASILAQTLGVNVNWLLTGAGSWRPEAGSKPHTADNIEDAIAIRGEVPVISWVQAGHMSEAIDLHEPGVAEEWVPTTITVGEHTFALHVTGDSMMPEFPPGRLIVVEPDMQWEVGDFVVAANSENETTFKQIVRDGGQLFLKPLNDRYPIIPVDHDYRIVGVVRGQQKTYR